MGYIRRPKSTNVGGQDLKAEPDRSLTNDRSLPAPLYRPTLGVAHRNLQDVIGARSMLGIGKPGVSHCKADHLEALTGH
jgi:hypothetical protein